MISDKYKTDYSVHTHIYVCIIIHMCACNLFVIVLAYFNSKRQKIHLPALSVWSVDDPHPQDEVSVDLLTFLSIFFILFISGHSSIIQGCLV